MRFRETLWFKKGVQDAEAAVRELDGEHGDAPIDTLPIEDRYLDDGTLQRSDTLEYGLHTGRTEGLELVHDTQHAGVDERVLIGEMKRGRRVYFAMIAGAAILGGAAFLIV